MASCRESAFALGLCCCFRHGSVFIVSAKIRFFPLNHQMFSQKLLGVNDIFNGMICRGGPCARPHPAWHHRVVGMRFRQFMPRTCVVAIRVADGHRARPCKSLVVFSGLLHHLNGFSASLLNDHLARLSLADALALEVVKLNLFAAAVNGQVGDTSSRSRIQAASESRVPSSK